MSATAEILNDLNVTANDWSTLAIFWHGYFVLLILRMLLGERPSRRTIAVLISLPLLSVSSLALLAGDPFNSRMVGLIFLLLNLLVLAIPAGRIEMASAWYSIPGGLLFLLGWIYPHFPEASYTTYLYAAPLGLIPCPTLAAITGLALVLDGFRSFLWSFLLAVAGLVYGLFGALYLQVAIDWILFAGALILLIAVSRFHLPHRD